MAIYRKGESNMKKRFMAFVCAAALAAAMPVMAYADDAEMEAFSSPTADQASEATTPEAAAPAATETVVASPSAATDEASAPASAIEGAVENRYQSPVFVDEVTSPIATEILCAVGTAEDQTAYAAVVEFNRTLMVDKFEQTTTHAKNFQASDKYFAVTSYVLESSAFGKIDTDTVTIAYAVDEKYSGLTAYAFVEHADGTTEVLTAKVDAQGIATFPAMNKLSTITFALEKAADSKAAPAKDKKATSPKTGGILL